MIPTSITITQNLDELSQKILTLQKFDVVLVSTTAASSSPILNIIRTFEAKTELPAVLVSESLKVQSGNPGTSPDFFYICKFCKSEKYIKYKIKY